MFKIVDKLIENNEPDYQKVYELLSKLRADFLSNTPQEFHIDGKKFMKPGFREKWYSWQSKVLYHLGQNDKCISISKKALKLLSAFHHRNDIWIRRNIALSYTQLKQLKQYESALDELKELITYERLWFLFADMGNIHMKRQDVNNAFLDALNAALTEGDIQTKIKVFQLIVRLLEIFQLYDEVPLHLRLILAIRKKRKWNISQYFLENIKKYQLPADELEDEMTLY